MEERDNVVKKIIIITAILAGSIFIVGLLLYALNGRYVRFWADDYTYSAVARDGWIEGTKNWYNFNGARLSSYWFVGILDLFGMNTVRYLPGLVIFLWVGSFWFTLKKGLDLSGSRVNMLWLALGSLMLVFFSVLLMPTRLETLYWRMGTLHYTFPILLALFNLGLIFLFMARDDSRIGKLLAGVLVLFIAFISGANGEASGAWQVGVYLAALIILWLINRSNKQHLDLSYLVFAMVGSLLAIVLMAKSPANTWRMEAMPPPNNLGEFVYYTLRYSFDFVWDSVKTQPLPNLIFILGSMALSLAVISESGLTLSTRKALLGILAALTISAGLIIFTVAPSVYAGTNYPAPRALMPARFSFLLGLMAAAFLTGFVLRNILSTLTRRYLETATVLILILVSLYAVRTYRIPVAEGQDLAVKADLWDKQDAQIKAAKLAGETDIVVKEYDVVETLNSLMDDPNHWLNKSAAVVYGVNSITALP